MGELISTVIILGNCLCVLQGGIIEVLSLLENFEYCYYVCTMDLKKSQS